MNACLLAALLLLGSLVLALGLFVPPLTYRKVISLPVSLALFVASVLLARAGIHELWLDRINQMLGIGSWIVIGLVLLTGATVIGRLEQRIHLD